MPEFRLQGCSRQTVSVLLYISQPSSSFPILTIIYYHHHHHPSTIEASWSGFDLFSFAHLNSNPSGLVVCYDPYNDSILCIPRRRTSLANSSIFQLLEIINVDNVGKFGCAVQVICDDSAKIISRQTCGDKDAQKVAVRLVNGPRNYSQTPMQTSNGA